MIQVFQVAPRPLTPMPKPERNPSYLRFIRTFPCVVCGGWRWIEAAHFGAHGMGQKASDLDTLPLCVRDHRTGLLSYHELGPVKFALAHRLDITDLIQFFNQMWKQRSKS